MSMGFGDFNSDGYPDLSYIRHPSGANFISKVLLSDNGKAFSRDCSMGNLPIGTYYYPFLTDLNNDGLLDQFFLNTFYTGSSSPLYSASSIFTVGEKNNESDEGYSSVGYSSANSLHAPEYYQNIKFVDINGDGFQDIIKYNSSTISVTFQNGNILNILPPETPSTYAVIWSHAPTGTGIIYLDPIDINGDGKADFLYLYPKGGGTYDLRVNYSTGDNTLFQNVAVILKSFTVPVGTSPTVGFGDFNGDGMPDFWYFDENTTNKVSLCIVPLHAKPDLVEKITSSTGSCTIIAYEPHNSKTDTSTNLPYVPTVVSTITVTDGMDGGTSSTTSYSYKNGRHDFINRQFLGFDTVRNTNPDGSSQEVSYNNIRIDLSGLPITIKKYERDDTNAYAKTGYSWWGSGRPGQITEEYYGISSNTSNKVKKITDLTYYSNHGNLNTSTTYGTVYGTNITNDYADSTYDNYILKNNYYDWFGPKRTYFASQMNGFPKKYPESQQQYEKKDMIITMI